MNTTIYHMDESHHCIDYVKEQQTDEAWTCVICRINEMRIPLRGDRYHIWDRYALECGHYAHPRCYRKWCFKNECVGCPSCGEKEEVDKNRYCSCCWNWGHPGKECPIWRMGSQHRIQVRYRQLELSAD